MKGQERSFNTTDWFLILLAILSLGAVLLRFLGLGKKESGVLQHFTIVVEWKNVDARTVACVQEGELLYTAAGEEFGVVRNVKIVSAEAEIVSGGEVYRVPSPVLVNVTIELDVMGRVSDGRLVSRRGELLSAGSGMKLYSRRAELHLKILSADIIPRE